jgi:putative Mg2+ transporter-C (MgtC) family protein
MRGIADEGVRVMPTQLHWTDIVIRLALTILAGVLIGYNRGEHGKAAGLRTTVLVCLAASVTMIQVNLLLPLAGRTPDSFVMNDLFRLPLGILSGMGFIGGGAILRRDDIVVGVTTAATLWFVTVIGLCLGSGLLWLGTVATILGIAVLWGLQWTELQFRQEHRATLALEIDGDGPSERDIRRQLADAGLSVRSASVSVAGQGRHRDLVFDLRHMRLPADTEAPDIVRTLAQQSGVVKLQWRAQA